MYKEVLQSIEGIEIFPIISLILFLTAFTLVIIRVVRLDKKQIIEYSRMPLDDGVAENEPRAGGEV